MLKRIILALLFCAGTTSLLLAQAGTEKPRPAWYQALAGLTVGLEAGGHEYPLKVWYPGQSEEGYSVRALYLKPVIEYNRNLYGFDLTGKLDFTVDMGAPDPRPGAAAWNAKTADRKTWFVMHLEEDIKYPLANILSEAANNKIPGIITVFLENENDFFFMPDFPGAKKINGTLELGGSYAQSIRLGVLEGTLGLPLSYVDRYRSGIGFGLNLTAGWKKINGLKLGVELGAGLAFVPVVKYAETSLKVDYEWAENFSAGLEVIITEAFKPISIKPEIHYRYFNWDFWAGIKVAEIRIAAAYSPYMGMAWKF